MRRLGTGGHLRRGRHVPHPDVGLGRRERLLPGEALGGGGGRPAALQDGGETADGRAARHGGDARLGQEVLRAERALRLVLGG